jgi:hypothetical protein
VPLEVKQQRLARLQQLLDAPIPMIALENPVSVISTRIRKPDQIIQPWQFWHLDVPGTGEVKTTCLWLKGLPKLLPTTPDEPGRHQACWLMGPSPTRKRDRSTTYAGIADAMAKQWGRFDPARCLLCHRIMDVPGEPDSKNCGGDCLGCMKELEDEGE